MSSTITPSHVVSDSVPHEALSPNKAPMDINPKIPSAVPTLKVMRIQAPELSMSPNCLNSSASVLSNSLILPDSFGIIHIGETFKAYLGTLNTNSNVHVTNLSVNASLQTPTKRFPLSSTLEDTDGTKSIHIPPLTGLDAIVSRSLEEVGQHILRIEVSYGSNPSKQKVSESTNTSFDTSSGGGSPINPNPRKTLRKFYRFAVSSPLQIRELTRRSGESNCVVSLAVENAAAGSNNNNNTSTFGSCGVTICQAEFQPFPGLLANRIHLPTAPKSSSKKSAVELFDDCGRLDWGSSIRYLFNVRSNTTTDSSLPKKGIAGGDELGKAVVTWRKAMGEAGRIASTFVFCPPSNVTNDKSQQIKNTKNDNTSSVFVVHGSGLSVDVASCATNRSTAHAPSEIPNVRPLDDVYPVTVEPIDPPNQMTVDSPIDVKFLVINHSKKIQKNLQLQFRLSQMKGVVVCGPSFQNLKELSPNGGSTIAVVTLIAMVPGLFFVKGCYVVNLGSGTEITQPVLFSVFVDSDNNADTAELVDLHSQRL